MEKLASKGHKVKIAKDEDEAISKEMATKLQELQQKVITGGDLLDEK